MQVVPLSVGRAGASCSVVGGEGGCKLFIYRWGGRVQVVPLSVGRAGASCSVIGEYLNFVPKPAPTIVPKPAPTIVPKPAPTDVLLYIVPNVTLFCFSQRR
ncbi:hypothetical protein [Coleofasciculus sp. G2-EDA-02]|uniref:hypothetical protein n=1 Tax=Coleofasciculus sp. G2-EDA-02 TaxID=3069529 RepID=UPI004062F781